jgi:hypothetical protein
MPEPNDREFLSDVFIIALEGGISYWADVTKVERVVDLHAGMEVRDNEDREAPWHYVGRQALRTAINTIIHDRALAIRSDLRRDIYSAWIDLDAGQIDAEGADVIVQVAAFGEIVFG